MQQRCFGPPGCQPEQQQQRPEWQQQERGQQHAGAWYTSQQQLSPTCECCQIHSGLVGFCDAGRCRVAVLGLSVQMAGRVWRTAVLRGGLKGWQTAEEGLGVLSNNQNLRSICMRLRCCLGSGHYLRLGGRLPEAMLAEVCHPMLQHWQRNGRPLTRSHM